MSKFNTRTPAQRPVAQTKSYLTTAPVSTVKTFEGGVGFAPGDSKTELFKLAVANFVGENTFYEKAGDRDMRYNQLVAKVAVEDPDWTRRFMVWLRSSANMRSASLTGALEAAHAMLAAGIPGSRQMVAGALQRAEEPGEALAYWTSRFGRKIPKPVKRGVADAATRLYTEYSLLKYDTSSHQFRFGDVLDLTHPAARDAEQNALFKFALDRRHGRDQEPDSSLSMIIDNGELRRQLALDPKMRITPELLRNTGMTWEDILSLVGSKQDKAILWEALIPTMGYMALLKNLRGFSEAGISAAAKARVIAKLTDPAEVARSRQLPMRFVSAYDALATSGREWDKVTWGTALDTALNLCLANVPELPGTSLILVDISGSMNGSIAGSKSTMSRVRAAALFGCALALRAGGRATLVAFDNAVQVIPVHRSEGLLPLVSKFHARGGTETAKAVRATYTGHDRVIIITDEQAHDGDVGRAVPANIPLYTWNLGGYRASHAATGPLRYAFAGLTDQAFGLIPLLEAGESQTWPF